MANSSGGNAQHSKAVAMVGLAAAFFVGVMWILPKFERHKVHLLGFDLNPYIHPGMCGHSGHHMHPHHMHHMGHGGGSHIGHPGLSPHVYDTPAISPVAHMQGTHGQRDYNLAGLAIETVPHLGKIGIADI